ncbi:hypothetical protein MKW98_000809 [Papaver atlanticum]|uniref:Major facilitator superfamily (MFS) profile domain-containing protein n=1 Tax=Papaver atlanticum TaxID=357466 RepID=A0AAD4SF81_9MAGN|nr:hypothetical protein MKW98_000809 [Papaver atlanticum]
MIIGAFLSARTESLEGMLLGRFLVGTDSESALESVFVSTHVNLCIDKHIVLRWRECFWVSAIPAAILALAMEFCAESPQWLHKCGGSIGQGKHLRSIIAMTLMDKLGRKLLLLGSFFGMAVGMCIQAYASCFSASGASPYLSVGGMLLFVLMFSLGDGPVPGLLLPEIFPNRLRAKAMSFCLAVHWVVNFFYWIIVLTFAGATWVTDIVLYFCLLLFDGVRFCKEECC